MCLPASPGRPGRPHRVAPTFAPAVQEPPLPDVVARSPATKQSPLATADARWYDRALVRLPVLHGRVRPSLSPPCFSLCPLRAPWRAFPTATSTACTNATICSILQATDNRTNGSPRPKTKKCETNPPLRCAPLHLGQPLPRGWRRYVTSTYHSCGIRLILGER